MQQSIVVHLVYAGDKTHSGDTGVIFLYLMALYAAFLL